ncbi:MAG: hypothetical protein VX246_07885 [Myxococcota bacterium]|nr:hypothetical protein [Myxococcota bacterium]
MPLNPRHPVIVGAAQSVQRVEDPHDAVEPIAMMERALRAASEDAGAPQLLEALDAIYIPRGIWKYGNPGAMLAERVGATSAKNAVGIISGSIVQVMIDRACSEIAAGEHDIIAIVGGESENSKRRLRKIDPDAVWDDETPGEPDEQIGIYRAGGFLETELKAGAMKPSACFSLCETALRYERGESPAAHRIRISELASRLSEVASKNPSAWIQRHISAEEIRTPTAENRMVNYPYTKLMTSNIAVDQSAAIVIMSDEAARRFGIAEKNRVYLHAATEMNFDTHLSERMELQRHPGMHLAAQRILELSGATTGDLRHVDLYSCFPFAVQASAEALGLDESAVLSVTGGLTFSGGPFGNYVIQAMARMVEMLRETPGELGLVGSVGGSFSKFAYGLYSTAPGETAEPLHDDLSSAYGAMPKREFLAEYEGAARVESYTVHVKAEGPSRATFSTLTERGERVWARSEDASVMDALLADEEACGRDAYIRDGIIRLE